MWRQLNIDSWRISLLRFGRFLSSCRPNQQNAAVELQMDKMSKRNGLEMQNKIHYQTLQGDGEEKIQILRENGENIKQLCMLLGSLPILKTKVDRFFRSSKIYENIETCEWER